MQPIVQFIIYQYIMWIHCLANIWKVTDDGKHDTYLVYNTNFPILSCFQRHNEVFFGCFLDTTSPFCFKYMYIKKKSRITVLLYFVFHVKMAACSGYTYVAVIRLEIEPRIGEL